MPQLGYLADTMGLSNVRRSDKPRRLKSALELAATDFPTYCPGSLAYPQPLALGEYERQACVGQDLLG